MNNSNLIHQLKNLLLLEKSSSFIFRTRFERAMYQGINFYKNINSSLSLEFEKTLNKLKFISDSSNMTCDGSLKSFLILKKDIQVLLSKIL